MTEKKENPTRNQLLYIAACFYRLITIVCFLQNTTFLYIKKYKQLNSIVKNQEIVVKTKLD